MPTTDRRMLFQLTGALSERGALFPADRLSLYSKY